MSERRAPTGWRGAAGRPAGADAPQRDDRVLVLMGHEGNRAHVVRQLREVCTVVEPTEGRLAPDGFDLAVADAAGLKDWATLLLDAKFRVEPTFLPVVLILARAELRGRVRAYWDVIDEFVTAPIEPREFVERIAMLLRTRRLALEQRDHLTWVVNHDRVTGLPNRERFMARIGDAVRDASVLGARLHVSVLRVPLDRVLTSFGTGGLDAAAAKLSSRLSALVGDEVTVARLGTQDWGLVHRPGAGLSEVTGVLRRVAEAAGEPVGVEGETVHLAPRLGVAAYPADGTSAGQLLDRAMAALATARSPEPAFYAHDVQHAALRFVRTEARLHEALRHEQFELWYQPQLDVASGRVVGTEALVRWRLPNGELVPPGQFLPVAQETGLICDLDGWVLRAALRTLRGWRDAGVPVGRMGVNVCALDLRDDAFVARVHAALDEAGVPPSALELELTESDLIDAGEANVAKLAQLRDEGVRIAVDDFGTGYSSLGYLRSLPITTVKIDRTFVAGLVANDKDAAITEAIVWLADRFGLDTVAEGIETEEQARRLAELRVSVAQGYLFGRPMPEAELVRWLRERD